MALPILALRRLLGICWGLKKRTDRSACATTIACCLTSTPCKGDATASKLSVELWLWTEINEGSNAIASDYEFSPVSICFAGRHWPAALRFL